MPLLKKKAYHLAPLPDDVQSDDELFVIEETKECFRNYDEYIEKVFLYGSQVWSCQYTGRQGLTYKDALECETKTSQELVQFPECYKKPVLQLVQEGEIQFLPIIVNYSSQLLKCQYFIDEEVYVTKPKAQRKTLGVITNIKKNAKEVQTDGQLVNGKENQRLSIEKEVTCQYMYSVEVKDKNNTVATLSNVLHENIRRKHKVPNKERLRLFLRSSTARNAERGMWMVKDKLIKEYNLPVVAKKMPNSSSAMTPVRAPLLTISGPNGDESSKKLAKTVNNSLKKSPKKDPSQRTLNFFLQDHKKSPKLSSPTKNITTTKTTTPIKPLIPQIEVQLEKRIQSPKSSPVVIGVDQDSKTKRSLGYGKSTQHDGFFGKFSKDSTKKSRNVSPKCKGEAPIEIIDKVDDENGPGCLKKSEKKAENDDILLKSCKPGDKGKDGKEICKENTVRKNTSKKQATLSEILTLSVSKTTETTKDAGVSATLPLLRPPVLTQVKSDIQTIAENERKQRELRDALLHLHTVEPVEIELREDTELSLLSLPDPKPVELPEELKECFGDIVMVTEFLHTYSSYVVEDGKFKVNPDHLISFLMMSSCKEDNVFYNILIGFVNILLKNLHQNNQSKKLSQLGINLIDIHLTKETISEVTKLYLKYELDQLDVLNEDGENSHGMKLAMKIVTDLEEKEIGELHPAKKVEVLAYLLGNIVQSDYFYDHIWDMENKKRKDKTLQVRALRKEIKRLTNLKSEKMKERDAMKKAQKEIDLFMVKDKINKENSQEIQQVGQGDKITAEKIDDPEISDSVEILEGGNTKKKENSQSKIKDEKRKEEEIRRLSAEVCEKKVELIILQNSQKDEPKTSQAKLLGLDRNYSRYWLIPGYYVGLFVEKTKSDVNVPTGENDEEIKDDNSEIRNIRSAEECSWYYYDDIFSIRRLINNLSPLGERESVLRIKLDTQFCSKAKEENKVFEKRQDVESFTVEDGSNKELLVAVKQELIDLGSRLTKGHMGNLEDSESWVENVNDCLSTSDLATLVVELGSSVPIGNLTKNVKTPEKWLSEKWVSSVENAKTLSRMCLFVNILDCCIRWDECTFYLKCKICRRSGGAEPMVLCDSCRKGYHVDCLRPSLDKIPEEWQCPCCEPPVNKRAASRRNENKECDDDQESDTCDVEEHNSTKRALQGSCVICHQKGDVIQCYYCPRVFHRACHDPPLRRLPRGRWKCCRCNRRPRAVINADSDSGSDVDYVDTISDDEGGMSKPWHCKGRKTRSRKRKLSSPTIWGDEIEEQYEDCDDEDQVQSSDDDESEEEEDRNEDYCNECGEDGNLICCDDCPKVYHIECHNPPMKNIPRGAWKCSECRQPSRSSRKRRIDVSTTEKPKKPTKSRRMECVETVETVKKSERTTRSNRFDNKPSQNLRKRKSNVPLSDSGEENGGKRNSRQNPEIRKCELLLKCLVQHEDSWPFLEPVDISEVPDYFEVVSCPMDFETIRNKLDGLEYSNYKDFLNDVQLIFSNSSAYNLETSDHGIAGKSIFSYFQEVLQSYFPDYEVAKRRSSRKNRKCS